MKKFVVLDWYDSLDDPDLIGYYDTIEEAENAVDLWADDTDGECDCIIYPTDNPKYAKILSLAEGKEPELGD